MKYSVLALAAWLCCATAIQHSAIDYISPRGQIAINDNKVWESLSQNVLSRPYEPKRFPNGIINLGLAENWLIQDELAAYLKENFTIDPLYHLTYGQGAAASPKLREALATYFNEYFHPFTPVNKSEIIVASGVTSLIDSIAWNTCSDNEGILVPQPLYNGFPTDIHFRGHAKLINASFVWPDRGYSLDDVFDPVMIRKSLDRAWTDHQKQNITMRGVMIANPHNPLGRCYSEEALKTIASFCGEHKIHFISDEIYANSVFENKNATDATTFTSVLSLNLNSTIDSDLVHVMYGMSKDFGASGLRLGALHSRNEEMIKAAFGVNLFSWPSYLAQDMWARLLEDKTATKDFLDKNSDRLATSYEYVTKWLDDLKIEYYHGGNAGLFIWVRILHEGSSVTPAKLIEECRKRGVNIGDGQNFIPEGSTGWFRITFSYPRPMLELGLWRLKDTLKVLKVVPV